MNYKMVVKAKVASCRTKGNDDDDNDGDENVNDKDKDRIIKTRMIREYICLI